MTRHAQNQQIDAPPERVEIASYRKLIDRLPVTLRPELNGELAEWQTLFPFERQRMREFMRGVQSFDPAALNALVEPLRRLEEKMGVSRWDFSENIDTVENASLLARSAYYADWRSQVQRIYSAVEQAARAAAPPPVLSPRIAVAILPGNLPYERAGLWNKWGSQGREVAIEGDPARIPELLLRGMPSVPSLIASQSGSEPSDLWLIDAGSSLAALSPHPDATSSLSDVSLHALRERVLEQVNTVPKNISVSDQTLAAIRNASWDPWWPKDLAGRPSLRRFVIDLYLSGNGALIFSNAFVEWASSEAIRRARPRALFARFGLRARPKAFTGIAIFENPQHISALPDVDDPAGSAVDALVLARYILLASERYPESEQTAFLCIAESPRSAYLILPRAFKSSFAIADKAPPEQIARWMTSFLAAGHQQRG
jgi:hypothetical protein